MLNVLFIHLCCESFFNRLIIPEYHFKIRAIEDGFRGKIVILKWRPDTSQNDIQVMILIFKAMKENFLMMVWRGSLQKSIIEFKPMWKRQPKKRIRY